MARRPNFSLLLLLHVVAAASLWCQTQLSEYKRDVVVFKKNYIQYSRFDAYYETYTIVHRKLFKEQGMMMENDNNNKC
jgi:hypothetical protein